MKTYTDSFALYERSISKEPRFVLQLSWDLADTDYTYFTSSSLGALPPDTTNEVVSGTTTSTSTAKLIDTSSPGGVFLTNVVVGDFAYNVTTEEYAEVLSVDSDSQLTLSADIFTSASPLDDYIIYGQIDFINDVILSISGQTQKINPDIATSTIGTVTVELIDKTDYTASPPSQLITDKIYTKLAAGDGLRGRMARIYVGYVGMPFSEYDLRLTYIVDFISYMDGRYTIKLSDIQREVRHKIFEPDKSTLNSTISSTDLTIPLSTSDTTLFPSFLRGNESTIFPGQNVTFIKIEDEVICINTQPQFNSTDGWYVTAIQRGSLGTRAVEHKVDVGTSSTRKPEITEHVFIEGAAPKIVYALLTGIFHHGYNVIGAPFDFSDDSWTMAGSPTIELSAHDLPNGGRGGAYDITHSYTDYIYFDANYIDDGSTWTSSIVMLKSTASPVEQLRLYIYWDALASLMYVTFNADGSGTPTTNSSASSTITSYGVKDFGNGWIRVYISGYHNTVSSPPASTTIRWALFPTSASGTVTNTLFYATLISGDGAFWEVLPEHWNLGISPNFVRLSDFTGIGLDYWNYNDDSGKFSRIENPGGQDGKKYIEKEMLLWMGAFMPVYSNGELGLRRLSRILSDSSYQVVLNERNVKAYGELNHDMRDVVNDLRVEWNWVDRLEKFTKLSLFIDSASISKHGRADTKELKFKTVHTGQHRDEDLLSHFDTFRDRYSGPPLKIKVDCMPSMSHIEVGDTVLLQLSQVRDFNSGATLNRTFEVQQVATSWTTGDISLDLFGSSQAAGTLERTTLDQVLEDVYYTSEGTELSTVLTISGGIVTANGSLTGNEDVDSAIYYYDGDLTINTGVTVTITENVQLRIKGALTINGTIDGAGNGTTGGIATSQFVGGGTSDLYSNVVYDPLKDLDIDYGEQGYLGTTVSASALNIFPNNSSSSCVYTILSIDRIAPPGYSFWAGQVSDKRQTISTGKVNEVPFSQIINYNGVSRLTGYPSDLRGNSGGGGIPLRSIIRNSANDGIFHSCILASGGAGGDGGAGLLLICRGLNFGGSGKIDLSGGDSSAGSSKASVGYDTFYAGAGAPGAPGALLILLDGQITSPDIYSATFIANYGDAPHGSVFEADWSSVTENDLRWYLYTPENWPYGDAVWNGAPENVSENIDMLESAHRVQYIPEPQNIDPIYGPPLNERGKYSEILFFQNAATPTAGAAYGTGVSITPDGSRFAVLSRPTGNDNIYVCRNAKNPEREQTIGLLTEGSSVEISGDGNRISGIVSSAPNLLRVHSRSGFTWSTEQTIAKGSGAAGSSGFGNYHDWNYTADKLVISNDYTGYRLELWTRSGSTWTFQTVLEEPSGVSSSFPTSLAMSGDGLWLIAGDSENPAYSGGLYLYKWTGGSPYPFELVDSLTVPEYDLTSPPTLYRMGFGASPTTHKGIFMSYDGCAIAAWGTGATSSDRYLFSVERQGDSLKFIGVTDLFSVTGSNYVTLLGMSNNGLLALCVGEGVGYLFRRESISEGFKFHHSFNPNTQLTYDYDSAAGISGTGQFVIFGNPDSDFGGANTGHIEVWEYYPEAD